MKSIALVPAIALALALAADRPATQQRDNNFSDFATRVDAYVTLHRQIERTVPKQEFFRIRKRDTGPSLNSRTHSVQSGPGA